MLIIIIINYYYCANNYSKITQTELNLRILIIYSQLTNE